MKILLLGGTGAMGVPLVELLVNAGHEIYVTSRTEKISQGSLHYIQGNGHSNNFLDRLLADRYDVIVDFMVYGSDELSGRLDILLENTDQYIFFSSSRVYADSDKPITEDSDRLLDVCEDEEYLKTDEYALAKARGENLLWNSGRSNWTIIRPYITYNSQRLQLGVYEKENWLKRALEGKTVVFPKEIAERTTSFTYGPDVAKAVFALIGNEKAYGEVFHIATSEQVSWLDILGYYEEIIYEKTGKKIKIKLVDGTEGLQKVWNNAQIKYDRLYDRVFDSGKIKSVCGNELKFKAVRDGIEECLSEFLENQKWLGMNAKYEAWCDKQAGELTPIWKISGIKDRLKYVVYRLLM